MPASFGVQGPGDRTMASGAIAMASRHRQRVVAANVGFRTNVAQEVDEIEGEAVIVVDEQYHAAASCAGWGAWVNVGEIFRSQRHGGASIFGPRGGSDAEYRD